MVKLLYLQTLTKTDEMAIEDEPDSEEDERDDFQDVKSKSKLPRSHMYLIPERKKQSKDPASFANAMSAILSSSLKAHTRAVSPIPDLPN